MSAASRLATALRIEEAQRDVRQAATILNETGLFPEYFRAPGYYPLDMMSGEAHTANSCTDSTQPEEE